MSVEPRKTQTRPLQGRDVLRAFLVFFGVIFSVNGYMLVAALRTHSGVVSVEPYRKGLAYNDRIAAGERQVELGWTDIASLDASGRVAVRMAAKDGAPVTGLLLTAVFGRAVTARGDIALTFAEVAPGNYMAMIGPLEAGTWMLTLEATPGGTDQAILYRAKRRLWLKS